MSRPHSLRLVVPANAASKIAITQTVQGTFTVTDNGVNVGAASFAGVSRDIRVLGSAADDAVTIDLGGGSVRDVVVLTGDGNNTVDIQHGSVAFVTVNAGFTFFGLFRSPGGNGNDTVTISGLQVAGSVGLNVGDGANT